MARSGRTQDSPDEEGGGEFRASATVGTAFLSGNTFKSKAVQYTEVDGLAMFEGDIVLGSADDLRVDPTNAAQGIVVVGTGVRWQDARIPYEIDANLPNQTRVTNAIAHWEANTPIRFIQRTAANAAQHPDFVRFVPGGGCSSFVGRQGGSQNITLANGCGQGSTIHEIGHAVGLWHEQSREDRDQFITILWQNIEAGKESQFSQHIVDGDDVGPYDYGSIMHYPRDAFSKNNQDTIVPKQQGVGIGQRNGLSSGDIATVKQIYPAIVGPGPVVGPVKRKFSDDPIPIKKIVDDPIVPRPRFKKIRDDVVVVPGPFPGPGPGPLGGGGISPFLLATPHHAPGLDWQPESGARAAAGGSEQLAALEAQIGQLQELLGAYDEAMNDIVQNQQQAALQLQALQHQSMATAVQLKQAALAYQQAASEEE